MWLRHDGGVQVGVVDVGSNTVRLHVARGGRAVYGVKTLLGLGESVERYGSIPEAKLLEASTCVSGYVADARRHGAERIEVLVTSPGRQAVNGEELLGRLEDAAQVPVRLLSAIDEGRLAFLGAIALSREPSRKLVAVCDVGGGSAQIAVGTREHGPAWVRSIDIGSMRLTTRLLQEDPPGPEAVALARAEVARYLEGVVPPLPQTALAVGGSARALRRVVGGSKLGRDGLAYAVELLARTPAHELERRYEVDPGRARTMAAGAVILGGIRDRLGVSLRVARGGVREGAAFELESRRAAA
jgi:exopolyphosphatase/guanosine-5'-triphosphate,3'-diphosphate pyrophosphatase